ncbi:ATP-dependent zinc protease [Halomonas sp. 18H]|uniref:ATP-dependent zinc protease family protein n=1 Tax=Halomonas almeriensis TaxID=308163 RepID=UPI00223113D1|nr:MULTISPECIES: ATP-dependent zinc protease [Halomonas]MCW4151869.1 ATP-dependent zinc protease [Halomonas sp. 18H]MDN3554115.1 ATP-dependent zinc protease [Halomonas almeriensis]
MPIHAFRMFLLFGSATLLGGCALLPPQQEPVAPPVNRVEFTAGIQELEKRVIAQCQQDSERLAQQYHQDQRSVSTDVQAVGRQVRELRDQLRALDHDHRQQEATKVITECRASDDRLANKELLGRAEWISLPDMGTFLEARVDSGADTSSLSARDITAFERDGEDWVRFKLGLTPDDKVVEAVRDVWHEAPIVRRVRITQASGEESRPVIELLMTLGPIREPVQFTLTDRSHLEYPVLLGRRFLMDIAIVDVAREFVHDQPELTEAAEPEESPDASSKESP